MKCLLDWTILMSRPGPKRKRLTQTHKIVLRLRTMAPTVSLGLNEVAWSYKGFDGSAQHVSITDCITRRDEKGGKADDGNNENNVDDALTYHFAPHDDLDVNPSHPVISLTEIGDAIFDTDDGSPQTTATPSPTSSLPLYTIILGWLVLALDLFIALGISLMKETSNRGGWRRWLELPLWIVFEMVHTPLVSFTYLFMGPAALIWRIVRNVPCGSGARSHKAAVDSLFSRHTLWCPYLRFKAATVDYARGGTARNVRAMLEPEPAPAPSTEATPPPVSS
ncbi:hypothetical protein SLS62_011222 [Diatrype stigma]|uniref:Uncharacterized protein n=1 Tax=Diatrype stigma TaxID=117547 RepID=A0AAN9U526_9PEZI